MEDSSILFYALLVFVGALILAGLIGVGLLVSIRWLVRQLSGRPPSVQSPIPTPGPTKCSNCNFAFVTKADFCGRCGAPRPSGIASELLRDLAATLRQVQRFHRSGVIDEATFESLTRQIEVERTRLTHRGPAPAPAPSRPESEAHVSGISAVDTPAAGEQTAPSQPPSVVVTASLTATEDGIVIEPDPVPSHSWSDAGPSPQSRPSFASSTSDDRNSARIPPPPSPPPRKPFAEVLAAFMEQSNIRWGEIIGGLLIIGCSTALVVSLWAQISSIPVLKFLIFTTVTAALFGVGLYTEHRWKLPTTSRGILTIATLLVPLNFLAIAAVSGSTIPPGALVIGSELIAPAVFLCLVYFAGRVLTPKWPHLLAVGVLGSSVGQLLIRHFATPGYSPRLLLALGAFPIACYVAATAWKLRIAMADSVIDETETNAIFITLGAATFAALLPFGLLLYKSGSVSMAMMYLAPLVTLGGMPMLASGTLLWRRVLDKRLTASRTAGTSIAVIGAMVVLSGMILAWPNPASIVPAALFNFAVFTMLAVFLELPVAHLFAAGCLGLAYLVLFHVAMGHVSWQNLRVVSLLEVMNNISTGQALLPLFVLLLAVSEWLARKKRKLDGNWYLVASVAVAVISLVLVTRYGVDLVGDPEGLWFIYLLYATGGLWIAWRKQVAAFAWIASALLLMSFAQAMNQRLAIAFPWQAALLAHASVCAVAAVVVARFKSARQALSRPLNAAALITSFFAIWFFLLNGRSEPTAMLSQDMFWLAAVWLVLLWLNRRKALFTSFQIALTVGLVVAIKASLQQYDWYTWHGSLHPWSLQIQGVALLLLSLGWIALRLLWSNNFRFVDQDDELGPNEAASPRASIAPIEHWRQAAWRLLNSRLSFDRFVMWSVLAGFVLLSIYGALSGVKQELTARGGETPVWNIGGFPHQYAFGLASWILLGLLIIAMLANMWQRRRAVYFLGAVGALATLCPLVAGWWETQIATASAWRWTATVFLVAVSVPLWFRERFSPINFSLSWSGEEGDQKDRHGDLPGDSPDTQRQAEAYRTLAQRTRILLLAVTLTPLLLLTIYPALRAIYYMPVHGPSSGVFYLLGDTLSYVIPVVVAALVLIAYAVRERLVTYAFSAGLLFNLTVTMVYLLAVVAVHGSMDRVVWAQTIQLNAITSALYALLWLSARGRWKDVLTGGARATAERLLELQIGIAVTANVLLISIVTLHLIGRPNWTGNGTIAAGGLYGWLAFVLATIAAVWLCRISRRPTRALGLCAILLAAGCLLAFTAARLEPYSLTGFHTLVIAFCAVAWLMWLSAKLPANLLANEDGPIARCLRLISGQQISGLATNWQRDATICSTTVGALAVFLALQSLSLANAIGWSVAPLFAMSALAAALQWQTLKRAYLYAAGLLFTAAAFAWWAREFTVPPPRGERIFEVIVIALCSSSIAWLCLELRARKLTPAGSYSDTALSFHNLAVLSSLFVMSAIALRHLTLSVMGLLPRDSPALGWMAVASLIALMAACVWDKEAKYAVGGLYLAGLVVLALALSQIDLSPTRLGWAGMMALAIYAIATGLVWRWRETFIQWATQLKIPRRLQPDVTHLEWLVVFNVLAILVVTALAYWIDLRFVEWTLRTSAAVAVAAQGFTLILLAPKAERQRWQKAAFAVFAVGLIFFGWAWLVPGVTGTWLNRAVILMVEMFAVVALFGLELDKALRREPEWAKAVRDCVPYLTASGIVALIFILCTEVSYQLRFGAVRISLVPLVTVALTLMSASVICVLFALSPKHDPLNLPEKRRRNYVYVAELMVALLFMHIRLTMPWLFTGFFERYWPLAVVAIAYLGVATSELLRRQGVFVIAHPLERTGVFLPLLPVLGFWLTEPHVDYSLLLFIIGGLYGLLSILRRSFVFGILATIAANGGLWYLWHRTAEYNFVQHPQLWLIPAACSVLVAAYLNREDFSEEQMVGIRYLALVTIYASSTADIFINGVANSPWLPMILAALAVTGVLCGIMFRIRAFLVLGSVFLLLAITTMIYYASENLGWTWLWYVAGIVTGMMIIATFAVFEKKRDEMLRVVEGLKEWQR